MKLLLLVLSLLVSSGCAADGDTEVFLGFYSSADGSETFLKRPVFRERNPKPRPDGLCFGTTPRP